MPKRCLILLILAAVLVPNAASADILYFTPQADTWIKEASPFENHGFEFGFYNAHKTSDEYRSLMRFDLSSITSGTIVVAAIVTLNVFDPDESGDPINVHRVTKGWTEIGANWSNIAADYDSFTVYGSFSPVVTGRVAVDITPLVQGWVNETFNNDGLLLISTSNALQSGFTSKEWFMAFDRPTLTVITVDLGKFLETGSYTGTGAGGRAITGLGFAPAFVIVKGDNTEMASARSSTMPAGLSKTLADDLALSSNRIVSLDPDGFTVGASAEVNAGGVDYYWVAFRSAPGLMTVGSYQGTGDDDEPITGIGFEPGYLIVMGAENKQAMQRFAAQAYDKSLPFSKDDEKGDRIQDFLPDGFEVGKDDHVNKDGWWYHYVAWNTIPGLLNNSFYTGNGWNPRDINGVGFQPDYVIVASQKNEMVVHRPASLGGDNTQFYEDWANESDCIRAFLPDGFRIGDRVQVNKDGDDYFWAAFHSTAITEADIGLSITIDDSLKNEGDPATFFITVTNNGPDGASGIVVADILPPGVTYTFHGVTQGNYNNVTGIWDVGNLGSSMTAGLFITVSVDAGTAGSIITNSAYVTALHQVDPVASNNSDSARLTVNGVSVAVRKTVDLPNPNEGDNVDYYISVTNNGPGDATGVNVLDQIPTGLTYVSDTPNQGIYVSGTGRWWVDAIANGDSATLTITASVDAGTGGSVIINTASLLGVNEPDIYSGDDSSSVDISVQLADVALRKFVDDTTPVENDSLTFTIKLFNIGPDAATGVEVTDLIPAGLGYYGFSATQGFYNDVTGIWDAGTVVPFDTLTLNIYAFVDVGAGGRTINNLATVTDMDQADPDIVNNSAFVKITVQSTKFRIATDLYAGDGALTRLITGVGFRPDVVILQGDDGQPASVKTSSMPGTLSKRLARGYPMDNNIITSLDADGFTVSPDGRMNEVGSEYHWVALKTAPGYMVAGSYDGDGADDRAVTNVGFTPAYVMILPELYNEATQRYAAQAGDASMTFGYSDENPNWIQAFLPNGFQVGSDSLVNAPGPTYHYVAWQEIPGTSAGGRYPGNGLDNRDITLPGFQPAYVILKRLEGSNGTVHRPASLAGDQTLSVSDGWYFNDGIQVFLPDGFQVGREGSVNQLGADYVWLALHDPTIPEADLELVMSVSDSVPIIGDTLTYSVTLVNNGPDQATGVQVIDLLPAELTFLSDDPDQGTYNSLIGLWDIGVVFAGDSVRLDITALLSSGTVDSAITNTSLIVAMSQADPDETNNTATVAVRVGPSEFRVVSGRYVGNGLAGRAITGIGFKPDVVIIKGDMGKNAVVRTCTMTGDITKRLGVRVAVLPNLIQSLDDDGFTVGVGFEVNQADSTYYWTAFDAAKPEMAVGTYTGDDTDDRGIEGVGFRPAYLIIMAEGLDEAVQRFPAQVGDASLPFGSSFPMADVIQAFEPDGFQVGKHHTVNWNNETYHYVAWKAATGRSAGSVYLGDGSDDRDITGAGFRPDFVTITRNNTGSAAVFRTNVLPRDSSLSVGAVPKLGNRIQTFLADGFQIGSHDDVNKSANTYYWMAFDDNRTVDLAVTKVVDKPTPNVADSVTYTITLTNATSEQATGIEITDVLPVGLSYCSDTTSVGSYNSGTGAWYVNSLAGGAGANLQLSATVDAGTGGTTIANTASLTAVDQVDVDAGNNSDTANITVRAADLAVSMSADNSTPAEGDTILYTVTLSNGGPDVATGVSLTDSLPAGVTYLADSTSQGVYEHGSGLWTVGTVANASADTLMIYATIDGGTMGSILTNTAHVAGSDVDDTNSVNDSALVEILVPTPVVLDDTPGSLFPSTTVVGDPDLALRIGVDNTWAVGITLATTSTIMFSDGTNTYLSGLSNSTYVPAGASEFILAFSSASVSASFVPDSSYSLVLSLEGQTDEAQPFEQTISTPGTNEIFVDQPRMALSAPVIGNYSVNPGQKGVELLVIHFHNDYSTDRTLDSLTVTNTASGPGTLAQLDGLTAALALYDDVDSTNGLSPPDTLLDAAGFLAGRASFAPGGGWTVGAASGRSVIVAADVDSFAARDGDVLDVAVTWPTDFVFAEPTTIDQTISPLNPLDSYGSATIDGMMSHQISLLPSTVDTLLSGGDAVPVASLVFPENGYEADTLVVLNVKDYSGSFDPADFSGVYLYHDDGDGIFESSQDQNLGKMVFSGDRYEISGLSSPVGPGERFFVAVDVAVDPTTGDRFRPGIPLDGVSVESGNDGPVDAAVVSSVSHVITRVEKIDVAGLTLNAHTPRPGDTNVAVLRLNVQNNTLQPSILDSLRLNNQTAGPGTQAQLDAQISEIKVYLDDGNGVVDAWEVPLAEGIRFASGTLTTPPLGLTLLPGESGDLLVTCDIDSFCARDQDSLRVQISSSNDLFFVAAFPVSGTFPMTTQEARIIDGMLSFQLGVFPSADSLLITETTDILVLDVSIPGNGYDADTLRSLMVENQGTATDEHVQTLSLYADGGNGVFEPGGGDDVYIGTFVSLGANQYQISTIDYAVPSACAGGVRFYVSCDLTPDFLNGATFQFGIPVMGVEVHSGNDGPKDGPVFDPSTQLLPRPNELTIFPNSVGDKRVLPGSTDVLNFSMAIYNGYQTTVTLDSIRLFQAAGAVGAEILSVEAFADVDANGLFDPATDLGLAAGHSSEPYYYDFSNLALDLTPEDITYLFIAYDLATDVRDSVGVDFRLDGVSGLWFTPASVNVEGGSHINSPGVDHTDGMIASQITLHAAPAERAAPGDDHVLAIGFTVPSNGFMSDRLRRVTISNPFGTAVAGQDISTLNLWAENGGDPDEFAPSDDRLLSAMLWMGNGWKNPIALNALITVGGRKCYVTFSAAATASDDRTFQAVIPPNGIQVLSGNDGPLDQTVVNPNIQSISTDPLITSISTDRSTYSVGQDIIVSMRARNEGADTLSGVTTPPLTLAGSATALYQSGPTPMPVDLPPATDTTMVWSYTATAAGGLEFCGSAHEGDSTEVSEQTCAETVAIQNKPSDISMVLTDATPIGVNRGQENVDAIGVTVEYTGYDSLSAPACFKGLVVSLEDGAGLPLAPNSILREITLVSSSGSNQPFALIDSTLNPLHLYMQEPAAVLPGASVGIDLAMDIAASASASQFRLSVAAAVDIHVADANDGLPVPLTTGSSFPWETNLIDVAAAAESLVVYTEDAGTRFVNLGRDGVQVFSFKLFNNGPPDGANEILKSVVLSFSDSTGVWIPPNYVISALSLRSDGATLFLGEDIPASGHELTCNLTNALLLAPGIEKEVTVFVDLRSFAQPDGFYLSLNNPGSITARDNNSGELVVVSVGGQTGSFPVVSPLILFQAPASGISTVHESMVPPDILPSTAGIPLLETVYSHADTSGSASSIVVDSLAMVFIDMVGNPVYPGDYFSQLRVLHSGGTLATLPSLSSLDNVVECAFSTPVTFAPMAAETFCVFVDAKGLFSPAEFRVRIERQHVVAYDANTGERILAVAGDFPFLSDPSRLQLAGGSVACGLVSRLPANVSGHESALPAFEFIVQNNDPPGYTPSQLQSFAIAVRSWNGKAIDPTKIIAGAAVMRGDSALAQATIGPLSITLSLPDSAVITTPGASDTLTVVVDLDADGDHTFRFAVLDTASIDIRDAVTGAAIAAGTVGDVGYPLITNVAHLLGTDQGKAFTNYPNPFAAGRENTRITYYLDAAARVTLKLYTLWGAEVATLVDGQEKAAGLHQDVVWAGRNDGGDVVNNGVYYLVLEVDFDGGDSKTFKRKVGVIR